MPITLPRLFVRRREVDPATKQHVLKMAIGVASDPRRMAEVPEAYRNEVDMVAKALTSQGSWDTPIQRRRQQRHGGPVPAHVVAARAASALDPSLSITPPEIETALRAQGMDWVEPFAPGTPLTPFYGYGRRARQLDYTIGYNVTTDTRPDRIPFATLKRLYDSYDVARICVVPGTLVVAKRGLVPIEAVQVGEEVLTHLGRWRRVRETTASPVGSRQVYEVTSGGLDKLVATGEHPVLVARYTHTQQRRRVMRDMDFVDVADLEPRGEATNARWHYDAAVLPALAEEHEEAFDLLPWLGEGFAENDGQIVRRGAGGGRFVKIPARIAYSQELGRVLGWYLAEGSQSHGRSLNFVLGPEEESYAQQILADIEAVFGVTGRYQRSHVARGFEVLVSNSAIARLFSCGTARTKRLPGWAWAGGPQFLRAVLDAWALGDGCQQSRPGWAQRTTVVTASYSLAWQMRLVAISLGLKPSIKRHAGNVGTIRGRQFRSGQSFHLEWAEKPQRAGRYSLECDGRYLATAIRTVKPVPYDGVVHNLAVEEDESFVTTGGTVHNCTRHSINDMRSMRIRIEPMDGYEKNPVKEIQAGKAFLRRPDGRRFFRSFLAQNMLDLWRYDAAPIYRLRNRAGRVVALKNINGPTIAPMLDYFGDIPDGEAPAFMQFIEGVPWDWLRTKDLIYEPFWPETDSPYGTPPLETVLINANTDLRLQTYFLQFFTSGQVPEMFAIAPEGQNTPDDLADWQELYDAWTQGDQAARWGLRWLPSGTKLEAYKPQQFDPKIAEYVERRTIAAFGLTPQDLGILADVNRACYSDDTETLTENGWKHYSDVQPGERIATFNPETKALEFHVPEKLFTYPYEGEMVHFLSRQVDCLVTPDHKMWVGNRSNELPRGCSGAVRLTWEKVEAKDLENRSDFWFADHATWDGPEVDSFVLPGISGLGHGRHTGGYPERRLSMDLWLEFLGYIVSEGCISGGGTDERYRVTLSQNVRANPQKVRTIQACIELLPFAFRSYTDKGGTVRWQVSDKALWTWLRENVGRYSGDKRLPDLWRSLGKRQLAILFEALMLGDGTTDPDPNATNRTYFTKSKALADDVQEVAVRIGLRAQVTPRPVGGVYRVMMSEPTRLGYQLRGSKNVTREHYQGTVWCFHVPPNHLFLTRRNGKVTVAGNTSDTQMDTQFRISSLPTVGYYEDLFDSVLQDDLDLPIQVRFDTGREKEDRLMEAQAHQIYVSIGAESPDEVREKVLGYRINPEEKVPRLFDSVRLGPIPLAYLMSVAGDVDPLTGAPRPGSVMQREFTTPTDRPPDLEAIMRPDAPRVPGNNAHGAPMPRELPRPGGRGTGPNLGTPGMGFVGYGHASRGSSGQGSGVKSLQVDVVAECATAEEARALLNRLADESPELEFETIGRFVVKGFAGLEVMAQGGREDYSGDLERWRRNATKAVMRGRRPRLFADTDIPPEVVDRIWSRLADATTKDEVNAAFKSADAPPLAGLALRAADTGRVLLLKRLEDETSFWEFPGGHVTDADSRSCAVREWTEEVNCPFPPDAQPLTHLDLGAYRLYLYEVPSEFCLPEPCQDPEGEWFTQSRWWDPEDLPSADLRPELEDELGALLPTLRAQAEKMRLPLRWEDFHRHTDEIVRHFAPQVKAHMARTLTPEQVQAAVEAAFAHAKKASAPPAPPTLSPAQQAAIASALASATPVAAGAAAAAGGTAAGLSVASGAAGVAAHLAVSSAALAALAALLRRIYVEAYLQGAKEAADASRGALPPWMATLALPSDYWDIWSPQQDRTVEQLAGGSLVGLLRQAAAWAAEVAKTEVTRIADAIAEGVAKGSPIAAVVAAAKAILNDAERAWLIAETEYARARGAGMYDVYRLNSVDGWNLITQPGACSVCVSIAEANPHPLTDTADLPPEHPRCRCVAAPHFAGRRP
jgi:8-oxo-dGTP pyrophosphatase MutT (NUDIX family)